MNYRETFILVAEDCPVDNGIIPTVKPGKSPPIHALQYDLLTSRPYGYTQEDILYIVHAKRKGLPEDSKEERAAFFAKPKPCLRTSALGKKYGWGVHFDKDGKAALYGRESAEYEIFADNKDGSVKLLKAMRSKRAT